MMNSLVDIPILSIIIYLPLLFGVSLFFIKDLKKVRVWVLFGTCLELVLSIILIFNFDSQNGGFQFIEKISWIPTLNVHYFVGVDGISALFLPFSAILFVAVILSSWNSLQFMPKLYFAFILLLESVTMGIFCALDGILFFLFWETTLLPLYFLTSLWGIGPDRRFTAVKYTLMMLAGGIPILFGFILLALNHHQIGPPLTDTLAFDLPTLLITPLPHHIEIAVFLLLFIGFAIKTPLFPFHTWLPLSTQEGPVAIVALLTGLKLGAYGMIRFVIPLAPTVSRELHWLIAGLGVIGIIYGAVMAIAQTNMRKMLAYSSMSHVGLVILAISSFNIQGIQGAIFQLLNFSIIASGLFLMSGFLRHRVGSTDTLSLGGAAKSMPLLAAFFLFFGLASIGVPGTSGFPAELLIFISVLATHTGAGLAALFGVVLGASYFFSMYRRDFLGPVKKEVVADAEDLLQHELLIVFIFTLIILVLGFFPSLILDFIEVSAKNWLVLD